MPRVFRALAATAAGVLVALAMVVAVELFSAVVHPVPEDFGGTVDEMCRHVERYPHWVLVLVVPAWAVTALAGCWTARLGSRGGAVFVALLLVAALVFNLSMLPYPIWFKLACLAVIPSAGVAGIRLAGRRTAVASNTGE